MSIKSQAKRRQGKKRQIRVSAGQRKGASGGASRWKAPTPSGSPVLPEGNLPLEWDQTRALLGSLANHVGEWCGLPTTIPGERLIVEPTHPAFKAYADIDAKSNPAPTQADLGAKIINTWFSRRRREQIILWREADGELCWARLPGHHAGKELSTMGCSIAWDVNAEWKAINKLSELIPAHLARMYFLTGMFLETSKRSGVTYIFRKLRPTLALRPSLRSDDMRILACLCLHAIGYYEDTWAGAMCPTDDVIAHLMLMRGDVKLYWKRANQIMPWQPEAGI